MKIFFRTTLENDIKSLKMQYPPTDEENSNDISLISKMAQGFVFADLGSDFYSQPLFMKLLRPACQHTGLMASEIREMMSRYKEDTPKIKFEMLTIEDRIIQKVKESNDKNVKPSKNQVYHEIGGEKQRILNIINALINEGKLRYDTETGGLSIVSQARTFSDDF